jgi:broad specificity phosphatase PhoE
MAIVRLVRHGHAAAGFDADHDPGLDELGHEQATAMAAALGPIGPLPLRTSPLRRTRETAAALEQVWGTVAEVDARVAEIPSPTDDLAARSAWLREAMAGSWPDLGPELVGWRDRLVSAVAELQADTVVVTHYVAINAVIGMARGLDRLVVAPVDNCSITTVSTAGGSIEVLEVGSTGLTEVG